MAIKTSGSDTISSHVARRTRSRHSLTASSSSTVPAPAPLAHVNNILGPRLEVLLTDHERELEVNIRDFFAGSTPTDIVNSVLLFL